MHLIFGKAEEDIDALHAQKWAMASWNSDDLSSRNQLLFPEGRSNISIITQKEKKFWPPLRDFTTKMGIDWPLNSSSFTEPVSSQMTWRAGSLFTAAVPLLMGEETQGHNYEIRKWCKNPLTTFDLFLWQIRNFFCVGVVKKWGVIIKMRCQMDFINFELMKFDTPYFKSWFLAEMMSFSLDNHSIF